MVVDAVLMLDELLPLNMIGIKKVQGGSLENSVLVITSYLKYIFKNIQIETNIIFETFPFIQISQRNKFLSQVEGVAFKKTFSYAGFEMQKKQYEGPKIAMLNIELVKHKKLNLRNSDTF